MLFICNIGHLFLLYSMLGFLPPSLLVLFYFLFEYIKYLHGFKGQRYRRDYPITCICQH